MNKVSCDHLTESLNARIKEPALTGKLEKSDISMTKYFKLIQPICFSRN